MKTTLFTLLVLCVFVVAPGLAAAQPPGPPPHPNAPPPHEPVEPPLHHPDAPPPLEETQELMEEVMMVRLSRRLGLTDEQSLLLMRRFAEVREQQQALRHERMTVLHELRGVIREERDEAALEHLMGTLKDINNRIAAANRATREAIADMDLDVWQKAKMELFISEFDGEMRRVLQHVRGARPMGPPDRPGPPNAPRGPMMNDPGRPRPPQGEALMRQREHRPEERPRQRQRPPRMPDDTRRSDPPPPAE